MIWVALWCSALAATAAAETPAQTHSCVACHGNAGVSDNPEWPSLAGQNAAYLEQQITAFRDGERENPPMKPFVENLSDAEIAELAEYYADQEAVATANGDPALVDTGRQLAGYCSACHGYAGRPATDEWPVLAGQHAAYLELQLLSFKRGERIQPLMQAAVGKLSAKEFAALAAYYSQLQP
ncbi:cytochrome c4 [Kineobactrum salinum]|uniref:Cytochrome c4 n=2 Tax=Kineobactrum salinum TaxID=2708301 RepID=A0A6C0U699_9GAMM|nr:cytochrome c4 [Kineobactrum salinum]